MGNVVPADADFVDKNEKRRQGGGGAPVQPDDYARDSIGLWGAMFFTLLSVVTAW